MTIEEIGAAYADVDREHLPEAQAMEQVLAMGQEEGMTEAVGQIDAILAEEAVHA